jgi:hypothetical protein
MAKFTKSKRKKIEEKVLKVFSILDKTNLNEEKYKNFFKSLSDKKFQDWANSFFADPDANFFLEAVPYKNEPSLDEIKEAAKLLNLPLEERVTFPHEDGIKTDKPVPVGYIIVKRHQQIVSKKNSLSHGIKTRNQKTGYLWLQVA